MLEWIKKQFGLGFTGKDVVRGIWTFVATFLTVFAAAVAGPLKDFLTKCQESACDVPTLKAAGLAAALAAVAAAFTSVKNFFLKDQAALKG